VLAEHIDDAAWREVILLTIGYLGIVQQRDEAAGAVVGALTEQQPGEPGQAVAVAGEAVVDAWPGGVTPACRKQVVQKLVETMADDEQVKPTLRAAASDALARLGDPRPGIGLHPDGLPDIVWCEVPAGPFIMGTQKEDIPALLEKYGGERKWYERETPQHQPNLPAYSIGKYPVTNTQYAAFVQDGGYRNDEWWREATAAGYWSLAGFKGFLDDEPRTGPATYGGLFDLPNHPVVGVSWYEAVAFCRWLTERLREASKIGPDQEVTLPTEAQWEKAARGGDGRIFPWGDEFDAAKCNMGDTGIGSTSAVGMFPAGASPYGVQDMSGNVDEWCRTKWSESYRERADESLEGDAPRVLRGGAFYNFRRNVRCAFRFRLPPPDPWRNLGFRVVLVAPGFPL
jgi:formylglycine-generating enzyme required for sulfatase activity